jgi:hypothetical protein
MQYNYFGITYQTIVDAFKGSVVADFGSSTVINSELDLAESEVVAKLGTKALQLMQRVDYMEIPAISGNVWLAPFAVKNDFHVWRLPRYNPAQAGTLTILDTGLNCWSGGDCPSTEKELDSSVLFTDFTQDAETITFGSSFDQSRYVYYASWNLDQTRLVLPSLAIIIRNRAACILGHQLYSRGEDSWKLVDIYCSRGQDGLDALDSAFIPSEFKRYGYFNSMVSSGIKTIKTYRG